MTDEECEVWVEQRTEAVKARLRAKSAKAILAEFEAVAAMLIIECGCAGVTEWSADLHLRDVFDKPLMRKLSDRTR